MIRWCSYCQAFIGEAPPFDSIVVTHGICRACSTTLAAGDDLADTLVEATEEVRSLMDRILTAPGARTKAGSRHSSPRLPPATCPLRPSSSACFSLRFTVPARHGGTEACRSQTSTG
jgi:hypothetical protein